MSSFYNAYRASRYGSSRYAYRQEEERVAQPKPRSFWERLGDSFAGSGQAMQTAAKSGSGYVSATSNAGKWLFDRALGAAIEVSEPFQLPQQAAFAGIRALQGEKDTGARLWENTKAAFDLGKQMKDPYRFREILEGAGVKDETALRVVGFMGDILIDPTLVAPIAKGLALAGKGIKGSGRLYKAADDFEKATSLAGIGKKLVQTTPGKAVYSTAQVIGKKLLETKVAFPFSKRSESIGNLAFGRNHHYFSNPEWAPHILGSEKAGPGAITVSDAAGREVARFITSTIEHIQAGFKAATKSYKGPARLDDDAFAARLDEIAGQMADSAAFGKGGLDLKEIRGLIDTVHTHRGKLTPDSLNQGASAVRTAWEKKKRWQDAMQAARQTAVLTGRDPEKAAQAVLDAATRTITATMFTGYRTSGFEKVYEAAEKVAAMLAKRGGGPPPSPSQLVDVFLRQSIMGGTKNRQTMAMMYGQIHATPNFDTLSPRSFVHGMYRGYVKRIFAANTNPKELVEKVSSGVYLPYETLPQNFAADLSARFGTVADKMLELVTISRKNAINVIDMWDFYRQAAKEAGQQIDTSQKGFNQFKRQMHEALYSEKRYVNVHGMSSEAPYLEETLAMLQTRESRGALANPEQKSTALYGVLRSRSYGRKDIDPSRLAQLGELDKATQRLGYLGIDTARGVQASEFLKYSHDALKSNALAIKADDFDNTIEIGQRHNWMLLSEDSFGPLKDHYVPRSFFNMVRDLQQGSPLTNLGNLAKLTSLVRGWYLGNPATVMRNLVGSFALMETAGLDTIQVFKNMGKAWNALSEYKKKGAAADLKDFDGLLGFLGDVGIRGDLTKPVEFEMLERAGREANGVTAIEKLIDFVKTKEDELLRLGEDGNLLQRGLATAPKVVAPAYWVNAFSAIEDASRVAIAMTTRDQLRWLKKDGAINIADDEIVKRAAFMAQNATFDYSNVPVAVDFLRRTGLSLFPAFGYFSVGRMFKHATERPGHFAAFTRGPAAVQEAIMPSDQEQESVNAMMADWLQNTSPLAIPIPNENGKYYVIPLSNFLPYEMSKPDNVLRMAQDGSFGGIFRPIVEVIQAVTLNNGRSTASAKYGRDTVFDPTQDTATKLYQAVQFLAGDYVPSNIRMGMKTVEDFKKGLLEIDDPAVAQRLVQTTGRYLDADTAQLLTRFLGVSSYTVDTTGDTSFRSRVKAEQASVKQQEDILNQQIRKLSQEFAATQDPATRQKIIELAERKAQLKRKEGVTIQYLASLIQSRGGNR